MQFEDRVAIVSGAASGMGLLTSQRLAENGACVVLTDVNEESVTEAAQKIRTQGNEAIGVKVDVRCYDEVKAAVALAVEQYGSVDILLNCA
ncbi:MAG: SDR family NAD(P)-dependent oxidoreductase, partial [Armatimonadota bacterium]